jgi:hypothetical protein
MVLNLGVPERADVSRLAEWFLASGEVLCSMQVFLIGAFASLRRAEDHRSTGPPVLPCTCPSVRMTQLENRATNFN